MKEKAAYLKGLIDGLGIDENTKEGKVIKAMSELLGELAEAVDAIDEDVTHAYDQINDLSEELEDHSRSFLQKLLKDRKVSINGKTQKASSKVAAGDAVLVLLPEPEASLMAKTILCLRLAKKSLPMQTLVSVSVVTVWSHNS